MAGSPDVHYVDLLSGESRLVVCGEGVQGEAVMNPTTSEVTYVDMGDGTARIVTVDFARAETP